MTHPSPTTIQLQPIGYVRGGRADPIDDAWGSVEASIELDSALYSGDALAGLDGFSHLVVIYSFHRADRNKIELTARHPRNNVAWPKVGIFAQRAKNRPNHLGVSTCSLLSVQGTSIRVQGLDAIDGTPILDIKPFMQEFEPRGVVREPKWAQELMKNYW